MNCKTTFTMAAGVEIETENVTGEIVSLKHKDKTFRIGDFVVCGKRVRGFTEGTRGIVIFLRKPKSHRDNCIEVHFENQRYSHTMKFREIDKP